MSLTRRHLFGLFAGVAAAPLLPPEAKAAVDLASPQGDRTIWAFYGDRWYTGYDGLIPFRQKEWMEAFAALQAASPHPIFVFAGEDYFYSDRDDGRNSTPIAFPDSPRYRPITCESSPLAPGDNGSWPPKRPSRACRT